MNIFKLRVLVAAVTALIISGVFGSSVRAWDYVWGDPGPLNYSLYQSAAVDLDGSTFVAGFFSGTMFGQSNPNNYAYFIQRIDASGDVLWTKKANVDRFTSSPVRAQLAIDGHQVIYLLTPGRLSSWSSAGEKINEVPLTGGSARGNQLVTYDDGGVSIVVGETVQRLDAELQTVWEYPITERVDRGQFEIVNSADGSVWIVGMKTRPLPTLADALVMIHLSGSGSKIATIKHYGHAFDNGQVRPKAVMGISDSALWIWTLHGLYAFSTEDGHSIGRVGIVADPLNEGLVEFPIGSWAQCALVDGSVTYAKFHLGMNGSRLLSTARCFPPEGGIVYLLVSFELNDPTAKNPRLLEWRQLAPEVGGGADLVVASNEFGEWVVAGGTSGTGIFASATSAARYVISQVSTTHAVALGSPLGSLYFGLRSPGSTTEIAVAGRFGVQRGAKSAMVTVAATAPWGSGVLSVYPCDRSRTAAQTVAFSAGQPASATVLSGLSADGKVCVHTSAVTHLTVDVAGRGASSTDYKALNPARFMDTRSTGQTFDGKSSKLGRRAAGSVTELKVAGRGGVPVDAGVVALNLTTSVPSLGGQVTAYACRQRRPAVESLRYSFWQAASNMVLAPVGADGKVCFYTSAETDLMVDVLGFVPTGSKVNATAPARLLDTRSTMGATVDGRFAKIGRRGANSVTQIDVRDRGGVSGDAASVFLNFTVDGPSASGVLRVYPCGVKQSNAVSVMYLAGRSTSGAVLTQVGANGKVCIQTTQATDLIADVTAFIRPGSSFQALRPARAVNTASKN
jgi:hypothetical protein